MDTIRYKLHLFRNVLHDGQSRFHHLIQALNTKATGVAKVQIQASDIALLDDKKFVTMMINFAAKRYNILYSYDKLVLSSFESGVNFSYDAIEKIIIMELSIPKFFYGNNVAEVYPKMYSKHYSKPIDFKKLTVFWHGIIKEVIKEIIFDITGGMLTINNSHYQDIQVARFDISYNQIFPDKLEAMHYLENQMEIRPPNVVNLQPNKWDSTISITTDDYNWKIYHKGTEFAKIQYKQIQKEHWKITDKGKIIPEAYLRSYKYQSFKNLVPLQNYADKILRYELRCSLKLFSYMFAKRMIKANDFRYQKIRRNLFFLFDIDFEPLKIPGVDYISKYDIMYHVDIKFKNSIHKGYFKKKSTAPMYVNTKWYRCYFYQGKEIKDVKTRKRIVDVFNALKYCFKNTDAKEIKDLRKLYKFIIAEDSKQYNFFLAKQTDYDYSMSVWHSGNKAMRWEQVPKDHYFEPWMLFECFQRFHALFNHYQLVNLPTNLEFLKSADNINQQIIKGTAERKNKFNLNKVKLLAHYLKKGSLDEMRRKKVISDATYFRLKKDLKMITGSNIVNFSIDYSLEQVERSLLNMYRVQYQLNMHTNEVLNVFL